MGALKIKVGGQYVTIRRGPRGPSGALSGEVKIWTGAAAPAGYLLCDGSAVSRTQYAELFAVMSTAYGAGDGSTTFNLPDLRVRVPIGAGTGKALGTTEALSESSRDASWGHDHAHGGGVVANTIGISASSTADNQGAHDHNVTGSAQYEQGHTHGIAAAGLSPATNTATGGSATRMTGGDGHAHGGNTTVGNGHSHTLSAATYGGAGSHGHNITTTLSQSAHGHTINNDAGNDHPFATVNYIVKT